MTEEQMLRRIGDLEAALRERGHGYNCDLNEPCSCGYDALGLTPQEPPVQVPCSCGFDSCNKNLRSNEYCWRDRSAAGLAQETACEHDLQKVHTLIVEETSREWKAACRVCRQVWHNPKSETAVKSPVALCPDCKDPMVCHTDLGCRHYGCDCQRSGEEPPKNTEATVYLEVGFSPKALKHLDALKAKDGFGASRADIIRSFVWGEINRLIEVKRLEEFE